MPPLPVFFVLETGMRVPDYIIIALLGLLISVTGWFAIRVDSHHEQIIIMQRDIELMMNDVDRDETQDEKIIKFWKLHRWAKSQINQLRVKLDEVLVDWPELCGD
jgi:hypothetical protein